MGIGHAFLWTFAFPRARAPRFFLRVPRSRVPVRHFFRIPCAPAFLFCVPSVCVGVVVGVGEHLITRTLCVYGRIRWAGSTRHCATTPLVTRTRCTILLARSRFGVKLVSRPQSPPSTSPLSIRHNSVISSQEREFSVPILSRSVFPRARVPKIPGTQEHKTRNECPSLVTVHTLVSANLTSGGKRRKTVCYL